MIAWRGERSHRRVSVVTGHTDVEQDQLVNRLVDAVGVPEPADLLQPFGEPSAEKAGATGDHHLYGSVVSQPRPSSVLPRGRYSQPTQPA